MKADPQRLKKYVQVLSSELVPRDADHPANLQKTATYLIDEFESHASFTKKQYYIVNGKRLSNVRAFFGPVTDRRIVVGAHYDTAGPYPGADDNASGVAGLLELGRLLSETEDELPMRVELISYPLEEPPYYNTRQMGSFIHANSLQVEGVDVKAMLALEMIGYFSDEPKSQQYPLFLLRPFYPDKGNYIAVVGKLFQRKLVKNIREIMREVTPLPVESINAPTWLPGVSLSDHLNYWWAGYPAAMITDTAFYRNPNYHSAFDTPDTLDYTRMGQVVDGVHSAVRQLAADE